MNAPVLRSPPLALTGLRLLLVFPDEIADADLLASYDALLTPLERHRQAAFHFAADRKRYLLTRAAIRLALAPHAGVPAGALAFSYESHGKPFLEPLPGAVPLRFNISHTAGLIAIALCSTGAVGVDVENVHARAAPRDIADHYFAPEEAAALRALPDDEHDLRFYQLWTLKESFIKATGHGLTMPLQNFRFDLGAKNGPRIGFHSDDPTIEVRSWRFWQARLGNEFVLALCAARSTKKVEFPTITRFIPLVGEFAQDVDWISTSRAVG